MTDIIEQKARYYFDRLDQSSEHPKPPMTVVAGLRCYGIKTFGFFASEAEARRRGILVEDPGLVDWLISTWQPGLDGKLSAISPTPERKHCACIYAA